jgi:glycosyltransferase involved in cell wall biosynthesis
MRTLVIAGDYPWPEDAGSRMRLALVLRGLRRCGPTELFSVVSKFRTDFDAPEPSVGLAQVGRLGFDNRPATGAALLPTVWRPWMPLAMPWQDRPLVQRALARFVSGHYDLVWYFGARAWVLAGGLVPGPDIIDLDDLEDQKIAGRLAVPRHPPSGTGDRARRLVSTALAGEEIRRWQRLHRRAGARVSTVAVCSQLDAERCRAYGVANAVVVPNGYRSTGSPMTTREVGDPPTVLFQGLLRYPPNIEAARLLALEVAPALRQVIPDVRIRLVGDHLPDLLTLHDPPRVTVTGRVADMSTELAGADVIMVPVRYGSGTRIKIVEAFAHRIPVVSTALGAEGLDATDGRHLLVGETVAQLSAACIRLLTDQALRVAITDQAHDHYLDRFQSDIVENIVSRLARDVAGPTAVVHP